MSVVLSTNIANGLKTFFRDSKYDEIIHGMKHRAFLNRVKKVPFVGEDYKVPVYASHGGGVSATFADAQNMSTSPVIGRFNVGANLTELHKSFQIASQALARAQSNQAGLLKDIILRSTHILDHVADEAERQMFGDGYVSIGVVDNDALDQTELELATATDARWFKTGMQVVFGATAAGALRDSGEALTVVTNGDPIAGTVEMSADLDTIAAIEKTDFIMIKGSAANNSTRKGIYGLDAYASSPTASESFLDEDRTAAAGQLAMLSGTGDDADILAAILTNDGVALEINGGTRDTAVLNPYDYALFADQQSGLVRHKPGTRALAGFSFLSVPGVTGQIIECVASPYVARNKVYLLNMPSFELVHLRSKPIMLDDLDGAAGTKLSAASGSEYRGLFLGQLGCGAPGTSIVITLS